MSETIPHPAPELKLLEPYIGKWNTEGIVKQGPGKEDIRFKGTDSYEWMSGRHFIIHTVDVMMGDTRMEGIEMIGYDNSSKIFFLHSYDNTGSNVEMTGKVNNNSIALTGKTERFNGSFNEDGTLITGEWEQLRDGSWHPWMEVTLKRSNR